MSAGTPSIQIREAQPADLAAVLALLRAAELPTAGVPPSLTGFLVAHCGGRLVGAIGLEVYGASGLLRSAVVALEARGSRLGTTLVEAVLAAARARRLQDVYLLTTTAADWFPRFGFTRATREAVPPALHASEELRGACPDSAVVMRLERL